MERTVPSGVTRIAKAILSMPVANPFQELYLTEAVDDPQLYWRLFSPKVITGEAHLLFRPGNVVLLGSNGAGKTMLLRLFAPDVLSTFIAHHQELPFQTDGRGLLGVGLNLLHAGFGALGRRTMSADHTENLNLWAVAMGDVLNYSIVLQLLLTLKFLSSPAGSALRDFIGADVSPDRLDEFARSVCREPFWFDGLRTVESLETMVTAVRERIYAYRSFANWNRDRVPEAVWDSKTEIGVPVREISKALVRTGILHRDVPLMIAIDQYETLMHIDYEREARDPSKSVGRAFCRVVNALLASRAPEVSFKLGVRHYSWDRELLVFGGDARIEIGRDYQQVNLDELLRRKENSGTWIFPKFAADVAARRLEAYLQRAPATLLSWLPEHLEELTPELEVQAYVGKGSSLRAPRSEKWSPEWNSFLANLWESRKFEARLVEVWLNQVIGRGERPGRPPEPDGPRLWNKQWWQKERREALLMQIASSAKQRRLYGGWQAIMTLSGANVLIFISLCREIWEVHERTALSNAADELLTTRITPTAQSQAIRVVSELWYKKQVEFPGGARRQAFMRRLSIGIRKKLLDDRSLSNPGHNGFSLTIEEYESAGASEVKEFLDTATDFGALIASPHTTKERNRKPRIKWYPFPILCPHFEIPAVRTKEPYYARLDEVRRWLNDEGAAVVIDSRTDHDANRERDRRRAEAIEQPTLFKEDGRKR